MLRLLDTGSERWAIRLPYDFPGTSWRSRVTAMRGDLPGAIVEYQNAIKRPAAIFPTDIRALNRMAEEKPIAKLIKEYRKYGLSKNTYFGSYLEWCDEKDYIHTSLLRQCMNPLRVSL